jgi:hypothetical protein
VPEATSSSSSPNVSQRLVEVDLNRLEGHPYNSNVMSTELKATLRANIERTRDYPPIIVRPHPTIADTYQLLDGHTRVEVLRELRYERVTCYLWPCSDEEALLLLATLNRLEGSDVPAKRAELIEELRDLIPEADLTGLLPESAELIDEALSLISFDEDQIFADLERSAASAMTGPAHISFAVQRDDEPDIEQAVAVAAEGLAGSNRRGRALAQICRQFLDANDA